MGLVLKPETRVATIIFVSGADQDWLGYVSKQPGECWRLEYRFRYYVDDKSFDSDDRKSWYAFTAKSPTDGPEELTEALRALAGLCLARFRGDIWVLDINGNGDDAMRALDTMPWTASRVERVNAEPGELN